MQCLAAAPISKSLGLGWIAPYARLTGLVIDPGLSPGLTPGTQLQLYAPQQWMSRNLLKFPPENSNGMGGGQTRNEPERVTTIIYQHL